MTLASLLLYIPPMGRQSLLNLLIALLAVSLMTQACGGTSTLTESSEASQLSPTLEFPVDDGGTEFQAVSIIAASCFVTQNAEAAPKITPQCVEACDLLVGYAEWFTDDSQGTAEENFETFKTEFMALIAASTQKDPLYAFEAFLGMCIEHFDLQS